LANLEGQLGVSLFDRRTLVLTDRSTLSKGQNYGVFSKNAWQLADMGARHAFFARRLRLRQHAAIHG
jgi:hypothetical protein